MLELHNSLNSVTFPESVDPRRLCAIKRIASKADCDSQGDAFYQSGMPLFDETLGGTLSWFFGCFQSGREQQVSILSQDLYLRVA